MCGTKKMGCCCVMCMVHCPSFFSPFLAFPSKLFEKEGTSVWLASDGVVMLFFLEMGLVLLISTEQLNVGFPWSWVHIAKAEQ